MKKQNIDTLNHDIQAYKYWIDEFKKVLRQAREYGLSINEIKQAGSDIKKYRLKIKQKTNFKEFLTNQNSIY
jgi:hypothetical protein